MWGASIVRAYRDVLAVRGARVLVGASAVSEIGNWLCNAALLGYVYSATRSAGWVGAATVCRLVPYVLLGPFGGAVADRYRRRTVLLAGDVLRMLVMAALAATVASGGAVVLVIAFTVLASAAGCAERPAAMRAACRRARVAGAGPAGPCGHGGSAADRPGAARRGRAVLPAATGGRRGCAGAPAHAFYAVAQGRVVVHRDGKAVVHLGPGDSFGERGRLGQAPRNATVTTEMDTTLLRVEGRALLDALEAAPALRPALDLSSTAPGVQVPPGETAMVDDPRWMQA